MEINQLLEDFINSKDQLKELSIKQEQLYSKVVQQQNLLESKLGNTAKYLESYDNSIRQTGDNTLQGIKTALNSYIERIPTKTTVIYEFKIERNTKHFFIALLATCFLTFIITYFGSNSNLRRDLTKSENQLLEAQNELIYFREHYPKGKANFDNLKK